MAAESKAVRIVPSNDPNLLAYESFLEAIPEVDEDGYSGILARLATAESIYDLDSPYQSESFSEYKDRAILITGVRRAASDFQDGLGVFLIVEFTDLETGERSTCTTGAISIVAQLARAYTLGVLPIGVVPRVASKPTKKGYYPQHLEIMKPQPVLTPEETPQGFAKGDDPLGYEG